MVEDRRAAARQEAYVSAALETPDRTPGKVTIAITRDISATGLLILTRREVLVGELVKLTCVIDAAEHALTGRVVRVEPHEPHELWRYKAALTVDGEDPVLARLQAAVAEQAKPDAKAAEAD